MDVHHYHPDTGEYLGTSEADESPLEPGVYLIPAQATTKKPPAKKDGSTRCFIDGAWKYIALPAEEPEPEPAPPTVVDYQRAIQAEVDATARAKDFNSGDTLASYVNSTVDLWAKQAKAFVAWRDNVWMYSYSELAKVQAGERPQPTVEEFLLELPEIVWP